MERLCIICGAKVLNINSETNTCSPTCTKAKKMGLTREEETIKEIIKEEEREIEEGYVYASLRNYKTEVDTRRQEGLIP